ncbi:MAG: DUF2800 domain-containing protein [Gordonibacter pamelaeae]
MVGAGDGGGRRRLHNRGYEHRRGPAPGGRPAVELEQRVDYSEYVPGGFGTADVAVLSEGVLHVIDLKYGKGVPVSAEGDPQLRLYALGAALEYQMIYEFGEVRMTIVQPHLGSSSTDSMPSQTVAGRRRWWPKRARLADAGEYSPGESQCRWCRAKAACRARARPTSRRRARTSRWTALPEGPDEVDLPVPLPMLCP